MAVFTNMATLQYNGNTVRSNTVTGEMTEMLTLSKTAIPADYAQGDTITYVISLINAGDMAATGLTVTDDLGAYAWQEETLYPLQYVDGSATYFVDGAVQPAPAVTAGPPLVFSGITVPANGNAAIVYEARADAFAPPTAGSVITNTVQAEGGGIMEALSASAVLPVSNTAELTITKALTPATVVGGEPLTYTFTIQNAGNAPATVADQVVLTDVFDPVITITSVTFNGAAWASPANYTMDPATGEFATVAGQITVPEASYTQNDAGEWVVTPGNATLEITGTLA